MSPIEYPDRHHLNAAVGWLELGAVDEADRELARLSPPNLWHAEVLDLRWHILAERKKWEDALEIARLHVRVEPASPSPWIHQSFALHELKRTDDAFTHLRTLADRFADCGVIPYNLACYACRLGRLEESRQWLRRAVKIQGRKATLSMAATDPDLAEIHAELEGL